MYEPYLKEMRQTDCTEVIYLDMDRDGTNEMLVWDGTAGTGGQAAGPWWRVGAWLRLFLRVARWRAAAVRQSAA